MKQYFTVALATGLMLTSAALIASPNDADLYLGVATGTTDYSAGGPLDTLGPFDAGQEFTGDDNTRSLFTGYRIASWFGLELVYTDHGRVSKQFDLEPGVIFIVAPKDIQTIEASDMAIRARLGYVSASGFGLHALAGYSRADFSSAISGGLVPSGTDTLIHFESGRKSGTLYGAGVSFAFTDHIVLEFNWQKRDYDDIELEQSGLGIRYQF